MLLFQSWKSTILCWFTSLNRVYIFINIAGPSFGEISKGTEQNSQSKVTMLNQIKIDLAIRFIQYNLPS